MKLNTLPIVSARGEQADVVVFLPAELYDAQFWDALGKGEALTNGTKYGKRPRVNNKRKRPSGERSQQVIANKEVIVRCYLMQLTSDIWGITHWRDPPEINTRSVGGREGGGGKYYPPPRVFSR